MPVRLIVDNTKDGDGHELLPENGDPTQGSLVYTENAPFPFSIALALFRIEPQTKMRRTSWVPRSYICLRWGRDEAGNMHPVFDLYMPHSPYVHPRWEPTITDLFADDWEVYDAGRYPYR